MQWDKDAREVMDKIPVPEIVKNMAILYAEKLARKAKKDKVSMDEVIKTRDDYFEMLGESLSKRLEEIKQKGIKEDAIDPEKRLNEGPLLYRFELCHSRFLGCPRKLIDVEELAWKLKEKVEELKLTEMIADKFDVPFMPHTLFTISISSCPNNCTAAEIKDFGVHGVAIPKLIPEKCSGCGKCVEVCPDNAIQMKNNLPVINKKYCKLCGACALECENQAMIIEKIGYRVMVGGHYGRWHYVAKELFKFGDETKVIKALENCIELLRKEAGSEEHLYHMVEIFGLEPLYKNL